MCERGVREKELGSCERKELGCKRCEREVGNLYLSLECLGVKERGTSIVRSWTMQERSG